MKLYNILEAKTHFSSLVEKARLGEEIMIGKRGKPIAKIVPYTATKESRPLGGLEGKITISADFDEEDSSVFNLFGIAAKKSKIYS